MLKDTTGQKTNSEQDTTRQNSMKNQSWNGTHFQPGSECAVKNEDTGKT